MLYFTYLRRRVIVHLILCVLVWLAAFILIPLERIKELRAVVVISLVWMLLLNNISSALGYYSYQNMILPIGRVPLFQLLSYGAIGLLMINWLRENSLTKILSVLSVAIIFAVVENIYSATGAFTYGRFDMILSFIYHIAALSIFVWVSLAVVGEDKVYEGNKSRSLIKRLI